ncbi:MAG: hypothetical protein JXR10_05945 [Cyclobacteriaceae bacterium]
MKSLKQYFVANVLILIAGLSLIGLTMVTVNNYSTFFLSLITGFLGMALTIISISLLMDLRTIRNLQKR